MLGAAVDGTDRNYRRINGPGFATDNRLERANDSCSEHDGIFGGVRIRAMATNAVHRDVHRIDVGHNVAFDGADRTRWQGGAIVHCDSKIRYGKFPVKSGREHRPRTDAELFGRLAD